MRESKEIQKVPVTTLAGFSNVELLRDDVRGMAREPRSVPTDYRRAVMALGLPGDAVYESRRGAFA